MKSWVSRAVSVGVVLALAGCTAAPPDPSPSPSTVAPVHTTVSPSPLPVVGPSVSADESLIATSRGSSITVYDGPDGEVAQTIAAADVLTVPTATPMVFLVREREDDWVHVWLPVRPNGSSGWVRAQDVTFQTTDFRVEVSQSEYTLTVYKAGVEVLSTPVGIGRSDRPTPGGVYYIRELLQLPDPTGIYGPYAYGLSGYSPVLDEFAGGDAIIGLHGTNDPNSFGHDVSSGCVRMPNDVVTELALTVGLPLGTPVEILAD